MGEKSPTCMRCTLWKPVYTNLFLTCRTGGLNAWTGFRLPRRSIHQAVFLFSNLSCHDESLSNKSKPNRFQLWLCITRLSNMIAQNRKTLTNITFSPALEKITWALHCSLLRRISLARSCAPLGSVHIKHLHGQMAADFGTNIHKRQTSHERLAVHATQFEQAACNSRSVCWRLLRKIIYWTKTSKHKTYYLHKTSWQTDCSSLFRKSTQSTFMIKQGRK